MRKKQINTIMEDLTDILDTKYSNYRHEWIQDENVIHIYYQPPTEEEQLQYVQGKDSGHDGYESLEKFIEILEMDIDDLDDRFKKAATHIDNNTYTKRSQTIPQQDITLTQQKTQTTKTFMQEL